MAKPPKSADEEDVDLGGAEAGEEGGKKKLPLRLIIIAGVAAVVVLGGGGAAAFFLFFNQPPAAEKDGAEKKGGAEAKKEAGKAPEGEEGEPLVVVTQGPDGVLFCTLPNMVTNMQASDGRPVYLKLKVTLEAPDQETADLIGPAMPRLQDMLQAFLRELRPEDLQGSQGTFQLRTEVLRRVNLVIAPARVNAVLIEEMLIS
ncbi:flagellar basal body-associated FliL family protein [Phenylobacterium sp.]|uniref:flagellar basal body-associated FliL family protein n=1 Tax=Phenylobacterium sp. TaxID=1871053 RepID=UPI0025D5631A|nr:flagellar basal body-associated FliL family protein [Phenylobacterium sp.]